jgi:ATP-dependent Clp protease ATP-binding subunit ClpA
VFERFSETARLAVVFAQEEARGLGHQSIGVEHVLLGVVRTEVPVVGALGLSEGVVRARVAELLGSGLELASDQMPFSDGAMATLEHALIVRLERGDRHVGPEHLLLAMLDQPEAMDVLLACGVEPEQVRSALAAFPAAPTERRPPEPRDVEQAIVVSLDDEPIGDLGNPRVDARLLLAILQRDGRVAAWLRSRGVDERAVRELGFE